MLMLKCKNTGPFYYPRLYSKQLNFEANDRVNFKNVLEDRVTYAVDIYYLSARPVSKEEKRKL